MRKPKISFENAEWVKHRSQKGHWMFRLRLNIPNPAFSAGDPKRYIQITKKITDTLIWDGKQDSLMVAYAKVKREAGLKGGRKHIKTKTWQDLFDAYQKYTPKQLKIAESTFNDYVKTINQIETTSFPAKPILSVTREWLYNLHSHMTDRTPRKADKWIQVLRLVFNHAKYTLHWKELRNQDNPCEKIRLNNSADNYDHWPDAALELIPTMGMALRLQCMIGLYTGQRPGAVNDTCWGDIDFEANTITVTDQKQRVVKKVGNNNVWKIHLAQPLRQLLTQIRPADAQPYDPVIKPSLSTCADKFSLWRQAHGFVNDDGDYEIQFHGLRTTCVKLLADAGESEEDIHFVTRQSIETIRHYARAASSVKRSRRTMQGLDEYVL